MSLSKTVSSNIKELRQRAGLSQQKLAERSKLSVRYISRLETTSQNITLEALEKVALGLGCPISMLVDHRSSSPWQLHEHFLQKSKRAAGEFEEAICRALHEFRERLLET